MKQKYYISEKHYIESNDEGDFSLFDLSLALAHVSGWQLHDTTPLGDAIMIRSNNKGEQETVFIPAVTDVETIKKHAQTYGLSAFVPFQSTQFAQELMTNFPCVITPIISHGGALQGLWKVESLTGWRAADMLHSGVRFGMDEYVESVSTSLPEAIGLTTLNRIGIGKQAYFYYPDTSTEDGDLVFMGQRALQTIQMDKSFMLHIVPAPELDAYAMINAPESVIEDARALADAQAVIQKAELKRLQEEEAAKKEAETEAAAPNDEAVSPAPAPEQSAE